jgi:GTPase SAR1 family protein
VSGVRDDSGRAFGLFLCGSGESGKSTFARQLKLLLLDGINEEEAKSHVPTIRMNLVESMQILPEWLETNQRELSEDVADYANLIRGFAIGHDEFTQEVTDALEQLWQDPDVQEAFGHRNETAIPDHMEYFFGKMDFILEEDYVPSNDDLLRARIRSVGIAKITIGFEGSLIRIYDVGCQKVERPKWQQAFDEISGVIFCVSFTDFDKPMFEELPNFLPRFGDSLTVFTEISRVAKFQPVPVFLICNKFDAFEEKITKTDAFSKAFPEYK